MATSRRPCAIDRALPHHDVRRGTGAHVAIDGRYGDSMMAPLVGILLVLIVGVGGGILLAVITFARRIAWPTPAVR